EFLSQFLEGFTLLIIIFCVTNLIHQCTGAVVIINQDIECSHHESLLACSNSPLSRHLCDASSALCNGEARIILKKSILALRHQEILGLSSKHRKNDYRKSVDTQNTQRR